MRCISVLSFRDFVYPSLLKFETVLFHVKTGLPIVRFQIGLWGTGSLSRQDFFQPVLFAVKIRGFTPGGQRNRQDHLHILAHSPHG